ncbi:MAG: beta-lactamase family protein [Planctomycetes bacterium]|nr:beta-lactamase family protein [Planctomycetia bacterium]MBI3461849.1 beta-lactamase family protein [Planctomycetota bacterium]
MKSRRLVNIACLLLVVAAAKPAAAQSLVQEGEALLQTANASEGDLAAQAMLPFGRSWSGHSQLFWTPSRIGARLQLMVRTTAPGVYDVAAYFTKAPDYGQILLEANGAPVGSFDGFDPRVVHSGRVSLGAANLKAGENSFTLTIIGRNGRSTGCFVGIDKLELTCRQAANVRGGDANILVLPGSVDFERDTPPTGNRDFDRGFVLAPIDPGRLGAWLKPVLQVRLHSGDFEQWVTNRAIDAPQALWFRWRIPTGTAERGRWEVAHVPFDKAAKPIGQGFLSEAPAAGKWEWFEIDLAKLLPAQPPATPHDYYVRVTALDAKGNEVSAPSEAVTITYAQPAAPIKLYTSYEFSLAQFVQRIESALKDKTVGYALVVLRPGKDAQLAVNIAGGLARTAADLPARSMSVDERLNIASVNKTITAVAVLQLLQARGLSVNHPVHPYLPADWTLGPNVKTITFRELLTHRSGIVSGTDATDYASLKSTIAAGINLTDKGKFKYQNRNFALFRVIIPYLNSFQKKTDLDAATSDAYLAYINQHIFQPIGISNVGASPVGAAPGLYYPFPAGTARGDTYGDWTGTCGGGGLHLSARELAVFLWYLRHTNTLLSPTQRKQMEDFQLGWYRSDVVGGHCYAHGGYLRSGDPATTPLAIRTELNSLVVSFSDGMQLALIVNSAFKDSPSAPPDFTPLVIKAYNESWVTVLGKGSAGP